jgi:2-keto-4-pentenoate hydratase
LDILKRKNRIGEVGEIKLNELIDEEEIEFISSHLQSAEEKGQGVAPPTTIKENLSIEQAYSIQLYTINRQLELGTKIVGKKIGLTSLAMQQLLGVNEPDYGHLLDTMQIENEGIVSNKLVLQPRVEGEIAFILKKELKGPNVTRKEVLEAIDFIVPAIEIVDSRVKDWKITLIDTVADNASSGLYVLGDQRFTLDEVDLVHEKMDLYKNGEKMNSGLGKDVLDHPAEAVAWLANKLSDFNISLLPGEVILSGAISAAVNAVPGDTFTAKFETLGEVTVSFEKDEK